MASVHPPMSRPAGLAAKLREVRRDAPTALILLATVPPMIEGAILSGLSIQRAAAVAPQLTAMPPFGAFHDLRWVAVFHRSWLQFGLAIAAAALFRSILTACMVCAACLGRTDRQPLPIVWCRALVGTVVLFAVLSLPTLLLFAAEVVSLSWMVIAGIGTLLVLAVVAHHGPLAPAWWSRWPSLKAVGWLLASVIALTVAGAVLESVPVWAVVPVAGVAGLFNAWVWWRIAPAVSQPFEVPRRVPVGIMLIGSSIAAMALLTWAGFRYFAPPTSTEPYLSVASSPAAQVVRDPVIDVRGFSSSYDGRSTLDLGPDYDVERFSYRGMDAEGRPLPYTAIDTQQSVESSVQRLSAQVEALHRASGEPVRIVATSEGTVIARVFIASTPTPPVSDVLMLSPLAWPDRVTYPPEGEAGWGLATGYGLRALGWLVTSLSDFRVDPDLPFVRSMLDHRDALEFGLMCPQPGVRERAIVPVAEAMSGIQPGSGDLPVRVVGGFHGTAVSPGEVSGELTAMLHGSQDGGSSGLWHWVNQAVGASAAAWQTPPLALVDGASPFGAGDDEPCQPSQAALTEWANSILGP
jgi:hypothetical protein